MIRKARQVSKNIYLNNSTVEKVLARTNLGFSLKKSLNKKPKIGIAVLIWERAEYLEPCLESLFKTNLYDYDVTFLLNDDGSTDPKVREIIDKTRDSKYKIVRNYTPKGHGSWGAAFNKAVKKLFEMDNFDIVGTCDSDVLFHPEWLKASIETFLWAKKNHSDHKLIKFSCFNSSDFEFHKVLGSYKSPVGNYVVKERMGDVTNMFFTEDLKKIGLYPESKDDETIKTEWFKKRKLRYFSTEQSYTEHIGQVSLLNQWRPTPVLNAVHGIKVVSGSDEYFDQKVSEYRAHPKEYYLDFEREYNNYTYKVNFWKTITVVEKIRIVFSRLWATFVRKLNTFLHYRNNQTWWNRNLRALSKFHGISIQKGLGKTNLKSDLAIDVVINCIERDLPVLKRTIESVKENLKHPINKIKIVGPEIESITTFCKENNVEFLNEDSLLPVKLKDTNYVVNGKDRSGWLFQQLLKLAGKSVSDQDYYLVLDSDTLLIRPHTFERSGKIVFDMADEYHMPYFKAYERLTGLYPQVPFSFVSHHTLIDQKVLESLKERIEKETKMKWHEAIIDRADKTDLSGFSEFETYGNYFFEIARERMILEYWYNFSAPRSDLERAEHLRNKLSSKYKTLSFQYYK